MNQTVKLVLYVVLFGALAALSYGLYSSLKTTGAPLPEAVAPSPTGVQQPVPGPDTNQPAAIAAGATNASAAITNASAANTSAQAMTNAAVVATAPADDDDLTPRKRSRNLGRATAYSVALFFTFIALSILIARDLSKYFAGRVDDFIFNDNLVGVKDPEYEEAERVWSSGDHLEAVRLMRSYLNKHPREQYVALRIAEIYETDLRNYLAAALEYEEVLKKKLPAERWGWAAIHLANLYSGKLDRIPDATKLLRRIVEEYGQTAAAKKARERLGIPEPIAEKSPAVEAQVAAQNVKAEADTAEAEKPPSHNLPKGFRPKQ